ncbi:putative ribonuclease H-like domain-containing protein, partial [Tanacetum coccineum]
VEAMQEELLQFKIQKVWTLVDLPYDKKAIGTKIEAIRLFLAYASFMNFLVYQMDVKSAFLSGTIEEEYETLSTYLLDNGFHGGQIDKTLFIKRVNGDILLVQVYVDDIIFGSTRKSLCTDFEQIMHKRFQISSMGELTFFLGLQVKQKNNGIFISPDKYVGEILKKFGFFSIRTASTPMETNKALAKDEEGKDVDVYLYSSTKSFPYVQDFKQKEDGIFISQDKYVGEILKKFSFSSIRTASTPMETNKALTKDKDGEDVDVRLYRAMIRSLMYLTSSRPDIMFSVCACLRFQVQPKVSHLNAVKKIFRYLKGRSKLGICYPKDCPFILEAFSDSDYAGASLDRKSTTGGC